jgi:hypothetical protein
MSEKKQSTRDGPLQTLKTHDRGAQPSRRINLASPTCMESRGSVTVKGIDLGARFNERKHAERMAIPRGVVQRGHAVGIARTGGLSLECGRPTHCRFSLFMRMQWMCVSNAQEARENKQNRKRPHHHSSSHDEPRVCSKTKACPPPKALRHACVVFLLWVACGDGGLEGFENAFLRE